MSETSPEPDDRAEARPATTAPQGEASMRRLAELPFDPRDERAIDGTARWMGALGRFQVLAGALVLFVSIGVVVAWTFAAVTAPEIESDTTPPLVRLGEVSALQFGSVLGGIVFLGILVLRGGVLLTDAAEDLEHHIHATDEDAPYLEDALHALANAFFIDATLLAILGGGLVWLGSLA
ncbi:MAG: hypothetical protein J0L92_04905 [Deltaproteobacteria bacterium]|nr:hypothetical protein [Deltaproteobacteria bacterium]